jgi:hypothetical protein
MAEKAEKRDRVWVGPTLSDGNRPFIRETETGPSAGIMGEVSSDVPTPHSLVELEHVAGCCFEVTSEVKFTGKGPAKVTSRAYSKGWDNIFGKKPDVGQA